jgi:branched-chain amino acid transport system permease protein
MKIPRLTTWVPVAVLVAMALFPVIGVSLSWLNYLLLFFIYLALANMWNLLAGYTGLICLCPHAFVGLAGYTLAIGTWVGVPFQAGLIAGAAVAALFALIISYPVFRMKGIYFAIGTLVLPEVLKAWFNFWRPVGNAYQGMGAGYSVKDVAGVTLGDTYWLALAIAAASVFVVYIILRTRLGLGLTAIRDRRKFRGKYFPIEVVFLSHRRLHNGLSRRCLFHLQSAYTADGRVYYIVATSAINGYRHRGRR